MMIEELKPCPFCESDDLSVHFDDGYSYYVWCGHCGSQTDNDHFTKKEAIKAWNTRPAEDALKAEVKDLKKKCSSISVLMKEIEELNAEKSRLIKAICVIAENAVDGLNIGIDFIGAGLDGMTGGQEDHDEMVEIRDIIAEYIKKYRKEQ